MTATGARRLAAILVADVVGFSRHMERDDRGTLARVSAIRSEVLDPAIAAHAGRVVKSAGDAWLVEFASADASLRCAVAIQRALAARNAPHAADDRIDLRIGINLGDVIADGDDIFGDGVNVAARLESLAAPGGICISAAVRDQVHGSLDVEFEDKGEQQVKNIARPIRTYTIDLAPGVASPNRGPLTQPPTMSIGVLPFLAAPDDPEATRRASSMTRDFAGNLARSGTLITVIPLSPAHMLAAPDDPVGIARAVNVRYLVEGELRAMAGAFDVHVRLLDGASGQQLWSESAPLGATGDARAGARALHAIGWHLYRSLFSLELRRLGATPESQLTPLDSVVRALSLDRTESDIHERLGKKTRLLEDALRKDPNLVPALVGLVVVADQRLTYDLACDRDPLVARMDALTARAVQLNDLQPAVWYLRSHALMASGRAQAALEAGDKAIRLEPQSAGLLAGRASLLAFSGRPEEALRVMEEAHAMDPERSVVDMVVGCTVHLLLGQYAKAVDWGEKLTGIAQGVDLDHDLLLAAAYGQTGELAKAASSRDAVLRVLPSYSIAINRSRTKSLEPGYLDLMEKHFYPGLRKAGFPES